ncbi:MAG TPA: phospholipase C, phosphocholine-specific [Steroidobacteraceae bacterium]|nr:phospholipase C, phosphocholine-specific [Steroidobacteraceae bacterium]
MLKSDRRTILKALGAAAFTGAFPASIQRALAIEPKIVSGTIKDVKHIVVLMQENRSFDHYLGSLRGVRGFDDPRAVFLPSGNSVFQQPNGANTLLPFRPPQPFLGYQFVRDLPHNWSDAHSAWNKGNNDNWVAAKGSIETMTFVNRTDIPFHYALADAFTVCDNYHCSVMGPTDPNRYYQWTGWVGQNGTQTDTIEQPFSGATPGTFTLVSGPSTGNGVLPGGPVVNNDEQGYDWLTYPERLEAAGVSWKFYQDVGLGLTPAQFEGFTDNPYIGNFGDASPLYFLQYQNAQPGSPLFDKARTGTNLFNGGAFNGGSLFQQLQNDVMNNTLPEVSWVVAPQAYCEHPTFPPNWGAWYISNVLDALTSNPEVWASTVLIVNYDENDGFFDHVVAPTPPMSAADGLSTVDTVNELYPGVQGVSSFAPGPYGLGARVPCFVVSPWSRGGWACSQVFDHTSVIQFIEKRFGVKETHITPWRRAISGDLTSALNFRVADRIPPRLPNTDNFVSFVSDGVLAPVTQAVIASGAQPAPNIPVAVPAVQSMPAQEAGQRPARALPYRLQADATVDVASQTVTIKFENTGSVGAFFQVRSAKPAQNAGQGTGPWGYTVDPVKRVLADRWSPTAEAAYDLSVYGANGFFRRMAGGVSRSSANLEVQALAELAGEAMVFVIENLGTKAATVTIADQYNGRQERLRIEPRGRVTVPVLIAAHFRWYDLLITDSADPSFVRHYAGHVENGFDSVTDPHIGVTAKA